MLDGTAVTSLITQNPELAFVAGYASGYVLDRWNVARVAEPNLPLSPTFELADEMANQLAVVDPSADEKRRNRLLNALPMTMGCIGVLAALTLHPANQLSTPVPRELVEVIDHSGATLTPIDGSAPTIRQINRVATAFGVTDKVKVVAIVAGNDKSVEMPLQEVAADIPAHDAPLPQAMALALSVAEKDSASNSTALGSSSARSVGILVVSNGNSVGDPSSIAAQANKDGIPVFTVDASANNDTNAKELAVISQATHAKSWNASNDNVNLANEITRAITPGETQSADPLLQRYRKWLIGIGLILTVACVDYGLHRNNFDYNTDIQGRK